MSSFLFAYNVPKTIIPQSEGQENRFICHEGNNFYIQQKGHNKFNNDHIFFSSDEYIIVLNGIILNKSELYNAHSGSWADFVLNMYLSKGDSFFNEFRGSFSGLLYDKNKNRWIIFTDQIGSKRIYYAKVNEGYVFASDISDIFAQLKERNIAVTLDINAAYMVLSYGFCLEDFTLSKEIRKLLPGNFVVVNDEGISRQEYYRLTNKPNRHLTEDEIIEKMDVLFRQAITRQFEKDLEYGYKHFVALSGGLDSRMTSWVANDMGYKNQLNFTFSQSDYFDETVPKKIASDLKHEWIFKALDNGLFLHDIDNVTKITAGSTHYAGLAHAMSLINYINFSNLGISHSGQLGDVIFGTYSKSPDNEKPFTIGDGEVAPVDWTVWRQD